MGRQDENTASGLFLGSEPLYERAHELEAMGHGPKDSGDDDSSDKGDSDGTDQGDSDGIDGGDTDGTDGGDSDGKDEADGGEDSVEADGKD